MVNPYVYKLVHKETGQYYIGYRCANKVAPELDLGIKYKTSSDDVKKIGFENFEYAVIVEFFNPDKKQASLDAFDVEQELIEEAIDDTLCLNKHYNKNGVERFRNPAGVPLSESHRRNISIANMGNTSMLGLKLSEETKDKMSKTRKGVAKPDEHRSNIGNALRGKKHTEDRIRKNSEAHKGKTHTEETKEKMRQSRMGNTNRVGKMASEETKAKMRAARAAYELRKKLSKETHDVNGKGDSSESDSE